VVLSNKGISEGQKWKTLDYFNLRTVVTSEQLPENDQVKLKHVAQFDFIFNTILT
jgi:hypothetical protein